MTREITSIHEVTTITRYADGQIVPLDERAPDVTIVDPHSARLDELVRFPALRPLLTAYGKPLKQAAEIDRDFGIDQLAPRIAREATRQSDLIVDVVRQCIPRIVLDVERKDFDVALGGFVDREHFPEAVALLRTLHRAMVASVIQPPSGTPTRFMLSLHSMADFTPSADTPLTAETLVSGAYAERWLTADRAGRERRPTMLFPKDHPIASGIFRAFAPVFHEGALDLAANEAYAWHPRLTSYAVAERGTNVVVLDLPKSLLAVGTPRHITHNLDRLRIDELRLQTTAAMVARGIIAAAHRFDDIPQSVVATA